MGGTEEGGMDEAVEVTPSHVEGQEPSSSNPMTTNEVFPEKLEDKISKLEKISGAGVISSIDDGESDSFAALKLRDEYYSGGKRGFIKRTVVVPIELAKQIRLGDNLEIWIRTFTK